jgi:hypothetical protein
MNANAKKAEDAEKDGHMRSCAIERAALVWEAKAKEILREVSREVLESDRTWYIGQWTYCTARAAGLRQALSILAREEP